MLLPNPMNTLKTILSGIAFVKPDIFSTKKRLSNQTFLIPKKS